MTVTDVLMCTVSGKAEMLVVKDSTLNVLRVINAAKASMKEGQVKEIC